MRNCDGRSSPGFPMACTLRFVMTRQLRLVRSGVPEIVRFQPDPNRVVACRDVVGKTVVPSVRKRGVAEGLFRFLRGLESSLVASVGLDCMARGGGIVVGYWH